MYTVHGRALCLEYRVSWVRVPPEAAHFFSRKSDCLGYAVLLCLVCLFALACFFLSSFTSLIYIHLPCTSALEYMYMYMYMYIPVAICPVHLPWYTMYMYMYIPVAICNVQWSTIVQLLASAIYSVLSIP